MKAIILAAGEGKRMRPLTLETPKAMLDVLGKPLLAHLINNLPPSITEVIIVVGYKGEQIVKYFRDSFGGRAIKFVWQHKQEGTGHALMLCKSFIAPGEKFLFILGDDLHGPEGLARLAALPTLGLLVQEHVDPKRFGVIEVNKQGHIVAIEEKPEKPKTNLIWAGVCLLDSSFFDHTISPSKRGELEVTDVFQEMFAKTPIVTEKGSLWLQFGTPADIEKAEAVLRDKYRITATQKHSIPVLILAGGRGTRMPENEKDKPKCLVDVAGKPMLARQIDELHKQGFFNIRLALGYKAEMVVDWLKASGHKDVSYVIEKEALGTGGALKLALGGTREPFIGINCDDLADVSLASLIRHSCGNVYNVVSAVQIDDARTFGLIECDEQKKICKFKEKDPNSAGGLVSVGRYYLQPEIFDGMSGKFMIENDVFPALAAAGKLVLHRHVGYWVTSNNAEQLKNTREHFSNN